MIGFYYYGKGIKKKSIAKVFIKDTRKKNGLIIVNNKLLIEYFKKDGIENIYYILSLIKKKFYINIIVNGGGIISQIMAIKLAISKALLNLNTFNNNIIKYNKLITTDSRRVERKKVGLHKSRKAPQYSKR